MKCVFEAAKAAVMLTGCSD